MKLPRWLVIGMLASSVLLVLAAAGWWWVTWPQRTARGFVELIAAKQWDEARRMLTPYDPEEYVGRLFVGDSDLAWWDHPSLQAQPRSWIDVLVGRQDFEIGGGWVVVVGRGKVKPYPLVWNFADSIIDSDIFGRLPLPVVPDGLSRPIPEPLISEESN